jgi:hypothetical protein
MLLTRGLSTRQRVMEAIRRHFRDYGGSPSHTELHVSVGIRRNHVGAVLRQLAGEGAIALRLGEARGIMLPRRGAMLSDTELELEVLARGGRVAWPHIKAMPMADVYHVDAGTNMGRDDADPLADIFATVEALGGTGGGRQTAT